jgi:hypothetical protein
MDTAHAVEVNSALLLAAPQLDADALSGLQGRAVGRSGGRGQRLAQPRVEIAR